MSDDTLDQMLKLARHHSGVKPVTPEMALDQDLRISGDDVIEFVEALTGRFGADLWKWPWQRFAELSEPHLLTGLWLLWKHPTWPVRGRVLDPSLFERLKMHHIASCIDAGHWIEP